MPRTDDTREHLTVRVRPSARAWIDSLVVETGAERSTVIRSALAIARRHEAELKLLIKEQQ